MLLTCADMLPHMPAGRDDPWVVPIWGQRLKRRLPEAQYLELAPAGHCPHHEAPTGEQSPRSVPVVLCLCQFVQFLAAVPGAGPCRPLPTPRGTHR
jgi:pimeloyl-ACP methyl ester carboxylesterase